MTKVVFFNPISPVYFVEELIKNQRNLNMFIYDAYNDVTQRAVSKYFESLGLCKSVKDFEDLKNKFLICSPEDTLGPELSTYSLVSDVELLTFQAAPNLTSESKLWDHTGSTGQTRFLIKDEKNLNYYTNRFVELLKLNEEQLCVTTHTSDLQEFERVLEEALIRALLNKHTGVQLVSERLGLTIEADVRSGVSKVNDITDSVEIAKSLANFSKPRLDVAAYILEGSSYCKFLPVVEIASQGFKSLGSGRKLTEFLKWLESAPTENIWIIDWRAGCRFNTFQEFSFPEFEIAAKLDSALAYFYQIDRFVGCKRENFDMIYWKKPGVLIQDLARFSPSCFVYKRTALLNMAHLMFKRGLLSDKSDINSLCAVATALESSPVEFDGGLVLVCRDTPQRLMLDSEIFLAESMEILTELGLISRDDLERNSRILEQLYPHCIANKKQEQGFQVLMESKVNPTLSVITCLYNSFEYTVQFLSSVAKIDDSIEFELVLVDNMSQDETRQKIVETLNELGLSSRVTLIFSDYNRNFAGGNNLGAKFAKGEVLLLLNNDTILKPGIFRNAIIRLKQPGVGIVGGKLLYPDTETVQHAGVAFISPTSPVHVFCHRAKDDPMVNNVRDVKVVTGACMAIRRDLFFDLGGFDEKFVNEFEDVDLCLRAKAKGWRVIYDPKVEAYHAESKSPGRVNLVKTVRNSEYLDHKWYGTMNPDIQEFITNENVAID